MTLISISKKVLKLRNQLVIVFRKTSPIFFTALFTLTFISAANKQGLGSARKDSTSNYNLSFLGTKTPYIYTATENIPPPRGYKPVFINYVGRHGARFLTDPKDLSTLIKVLSLVKKQNELTGQGYRLEKMLKLFRQIESGKYGDITQAGKEEQEGIGSRMYRNYQNVFKGNGLRIITTQKVRTQQSARAFLKGLLAHTKDEINESSPPDSLNNILRFYDISPAYRRYKKSESFRLPMDSLQQGSRMKTALNDIDNELFKNNFKNRLMNNGIAITTGKRKKITYKINNLSDDLYGLYNIEYSMRKEIRKKGLTLRNINFGSFFKTKDLQWLAFADGASDFLEKGPAYNNKGIQIRDAVPLLVDFIRSTDYYINHPNAIDAKLRFGHSAAISTFACLLGIPEASSSSSSIFQYQKHWQPSKIIPMSSNIQWILYTNNGHYLLKVLLNEREIKLPVKTKKYPYYEWEKVKKYYIGKLSLMHTGINKNMHEYLFRLR